MSEQLRVLVRQAAKLIEYLEGEVEKLNAQIAEKIQPYRQQIDLRLTVPGVKEITAAVILAEIGPDMRQFGSHRRLCSWAGVCPGNHLSAGKRKGSKINRGNPWLMGALIEACWGAVAKQGTVFKRRFYRHVARMGRKKAIVAEARSVLVAIYHVLNDGVPYRAPDEGEIRERERQHLIAHHRRCLQRLGVVVPEANLTTLASHAKKKTRGAASVEMVPPLPACVATAYPAQIPPPPGSLQKSHKGRTKVSRVSRPDGAHPGADPAAPPAVGCGTAAGSAPKMPRIRRGKLGIRAY
jgi:transposase